MGPRLTCLPASINMCLMTGDASPLDREIALCRRLTDTLPVAHRESFARGWWQVVQRHRAETIPATLRDEFIRRVTEGQ